MTAAQTSAAPLDRIHDPVHHTSMAFRREGANLWVETWFEPGAHLPEHFHPTLEEHWEILHGSIELKLDGRRRQLSSATGPVVVRRRARHELKNTSSHQVHARTMVIPAGHLEEFLTEAAQAARDGRMNKHNLPTGLRAGLWMAAFAQRFRHETVLTSPPPSLQRVVLPVLARFARFQERSVRKRGTA
jgi:quercetin dioxygenase-like cupin family protein